MTPMVLYNQFDDDYVGVGGDDDERLPVSV